MTDAGNNAENNGATPPPPPPPAPGAAAPATKPAWYENVAIVILALFCCSPLGLILVWINKSWTTKTKAIITAVIVGLAVVGAIIGAASGGSSSSNASSSVTTAATQTTKGDGAQTTTAPVSTKTCKDTPNTESFDSKKQGLYPTRAGVTKTDHEVAVGDCVRISGATTYVTAATVTTDSITNKQGIIVTVSQTNRDKATKSYNALDWKLQTPQGTIENMTIIFGDNSKSLSAGELVTGGSVEGTVAFEYAGPGTYYVQYKPVLSIGSDVGVWGITVP
jgi:hypothetical protein